MVSKAQNIVSTKAIAQTTGRRWCSHHMGEAAVEGGEIEISGKAKTQRWICANCVKKRKAMKAKRRTQ